MTRYQDENEGTTVLDLLLWQPGHADDLGARNDTMIDSIARDLELLLNSRRKDAIPEQYVEVTSSILNFGMPALSRYGDISTAAEQNRLARAMEDAIRAFEPRLKQPRVRVADVAGEQKQVVCFRLEAAVAGEQHEVFQLRLKPVTGELAVAAEK